MVAVIIVVFVLVGLAGIARAFTRSANRGIGRGRRQSLEGANGDHRHTGTYNGHNPSAHHHGGHNPGGHAGGHVGGHGGGGGHGGH